MYQEVQPVEEVALKVRNLDFYYGNFKGLNQVSLDIARNRVTAFIGPSGCGKSTLLRTFNRMYDLYPGQKAVGEIVFNGKNLLDKKQDVNLVRAKIGMVFQKPTPFPMTIYENIAFGVRLYEKLSTSEMNDRVEWALRKAALWEEVKGKLQQSGLSLSGGQQQRLCIAPRRGREAGDRSPRRTDLRSGSYLDGQGEELVDELKSEYTIAIVTHNMQQAARISDYTAFMYLGDLVEFGVTDQVFIKPQKKQTEDYITGRFG